MELLSSTGWNIMIYMKRTLLAVMLSGTAIVGHAAVLSDGDTAQADVSFAQQTGTTNSLVTQTQTELKGGAPVANGQLLAMGKVTSVYDPEIYEVDLNAETVNPGTYNGQKVITTGIHGNTNATNMLYIALESATPNDKTAVDSQSGIVLNDTAAANARYNIVTLAKSGESQTVPADTYTVKTTSYVWSE